MSAAPATTATSLKRASDPMSEATAAGTNLVRTTVLSLVVAAAVLVTFVLPAEYGIDPTGLGSAMGIDGMSGYRVSALMREDLTFAEDYIEFPLAPFESIEYKYRLEAGQAMVYSWSAQAELVYDLHSEQDGTDPEDAVSFDVGRGASGHGTYVAPYSGIHGWFWENRTQQDVTVVLRTQGFYSAATTFSPAGEYTRDF